ncbi:MAG: periplasmic heavy metal sensor [Pseudomonadota bacterium]
MSEQRKSGWVIWAAAASIGLNLLLVGILFGHALRPAPPPDGGRRGPSAERQAAELLLRDASPQERRAVRRRLTAGWRGLGDERRALKAAQNDLVSALEADPYDANAASAAFERWTRAESRLRQSTQGILAQELVNATPEARQRLANRLKQQADQTERRERRRERFLERRNGND